MLVCSIKYSTLLEASMDIGWFLAHEREGLGKCSLMLTRGFNTCMVC